MTPTIRSTAWSVSSAGPFTATLVAASNLSVGSDVVVIFFSLAHLTASARFRAGPQGVRIRPVMRDDRLEGVAIQSRFPAAFPLPAFTCRSSDARRGVGLSSRSAYRTRIASGPRRGYRFPRVRAAAGVGASYAPRTAVLLPPRDVLGRRLPLFHGQSLRPRQRHPHRRGAPLRGISRRFRFFTRPACPSPVPLDGTGALRLPLELRTPPLPAAHVEGGARSLSTHPELLDHISLILQSGSSLVSCDRRPTVRCGSGHSSAKSPQTERRARGWSGRREAPGAARLVPSGKQGGKP